MGDDAEGVGYLLKHRVADLELFIDAVGPSARAARRWTPRSSRGCSAGGAARPAGSADAARARGARVDGRRTSNNGIAEGMVVAPPAVEKHVTPIFTSSASAATGPSSACWPCSRCS